MGDEEHMQVGHQIQNWRIRDTTKGINVLQKGF